jgi:glycosyltransferase involved in cell wall biosynthesis
MDTRRVVAETGEIPSAFTRHRCLGVVIPVYNEERTVDAILDKVLAQDCVSEIVVVDDGSTDGTWGILQRRAKSNGPIKIVRHSQNMGKGAAIRSALPLIDSPVLIIQDADLEYDPHEYERMLSFFRNGDADVVYGSRFSKCRQKFTLHTAGNRLLTALTNALTGLSLTDEATCYKMITRQVFSVITLEEDRFGFCPEVTAKIARLGLRVVEVPISYEGRTKRDGKKIRLRDGIDAVRCLFKYAVFR